MYNNIQAKKDETCFEEQVMSVREIIQNKNNMTILSKKEDISDIVQLCDTVEGHH